MSTLPTPPGPTSPGHSAPAAARVYALAVRAHLDDLGPDVVEELAGGLEADLRDLAAESSTPLAERLGPAAAYAGELRAAAGLPPRAAGASRAPRRGLVEGTRAQLVADWSAASARLRGHRSWPYLCDLGRTVRPAWWLLRAWVAYQLLFRLSGLGYGPLPGGLAGLLVLLALAWASVELGRGRWALRGQLPAAVLAGNALAAVAVLPLLAQAGSGGSSPVEYVTSDGPPPAPAAGLVLDGETVSNLFPYDAQGNPLTGVQLLDDRGRPVAVGEDSRTRWAPDGTHPFVPAVDVEGQVRWNTYPLRAARSDDGSGPVTEVPRPVPTLPALVVPPPAPAPSTASPTSTPSATATSSSTAPATPSSTAPAAPLPTP